MKINTKPFEDIINIHESNIWADAFKEIIKLAEAVNAMMPEEPLCIWCDNKITEIRHNGPLKYIYCGRCGGTGTHENSIELAIKRWEEKR